MKKKRLKRSLVILVDAVVALQPVREPDIHGRYDIAVHVLDMTISLMYEARDVSFAINGRRSSYSSQSSSPVTTRRPYYRFLREVLYPRLRTVKFDFHLHRKGMVQDTIQTTVLDEEYMAGVQAIRDRDYETAIRILRPYKDYNAAVAFCVMDYNASALAILETLPETDQVHYMLAVIYSRQGCDRDAVEHYLKACKLTPSYWHRDNLDPEISALIRRYDLTKD